MPEDTITTDNKYTLFVERVAAAKLVWALKGKDGWANTHSSDDETVDVIPFWSDRAYAKVCARDEWRGFLPVSIPLTEFLESWCIEMANEQVLAGINWDANMFGKEVTAATLAIDLLNQLSTINSAITFREYKSIAEFIAALKELDE
jgi:hypothetical protein